MSDDVGFECKVSAPVPVLGLSDNEKALLARLLEAERLSAVRAAFKGLGDGHGRERWDRHRLANSLLERIKGTP